MKVMTNSIFYCDAFKLIKYLDTESIDLICIDPPYGIKYLDQDWDSIEIDWFMFFKEFNRILKPNGNLIMFQGWSNVVDTIILSKYLFKLNNWIIYDRIKGRGAKYNFVSTREDILWFTKGDNYTYNKISSNIKKKTKGFGLKNNNEYRALSNVWYDIPPIVPWSKEKNNHPTQKPLKLIERIIKIFSNNNDLVLDCFAGSGTTAIACENLERNFIVCDNNLDYFNIMKERLDNPKCFSLCKYCKKYFDFNYYKKDICPECNCIILNHKEKKWKKLK